MPITIKDTSSVEAEVCLSELSKDINDALTDEFRDLIKSPNFQDLLGAEKENYFYAMLFMRRSVSVLQKHFHVPFKVVDDFISNIKGEKLGRYAPFYYSGDYRSARYIFCMAHSSLRFIIEVEYSFNDDDTDIYLRPLDECIKYFAESNFKAGIKCVGSHINNICHEVKIELNGLSVLLNKIMGSANNELSSQLENFQEVNPEWLLRVVKGRNNLNNILAIRYDLISETIHSLLGKYFGLHKSDIGIRWLKATRKNISYLEISLPFAVTIDNSIEFRCRFILMKPKVDSGARYLRRRELINYWKSDSERLLTLIQFEGCMTYDPVSYFLGE